MPVNYRSINRGEIDIRRCVFKMSGYLFINSVRTNGTTLCPAESVEKKSIKEKRFLCLQINAGLMTFQGSR